MSMADTSLQAWYGRVLPSLNARQQAVVGAFESIGPATLAAVAAWLEVEVHTISGRITELKSCQPPLLVKHGYDPKTRSNIYRLQRHDDPPVFQRSQKTKPPTKPAKKSRRSSPAQHQSRLSSHPVQIDMFA